MLDLLRERLRALGFSSYEAKAYLALLQKSPVTGYELSRLSQIPSAKVYETIDRLRERGAITVMLGEPLRYAPIAPAELVQAIQGRFAASVTGLAEELGRLTSGHETEFIWNIRGYDDVMAKATALVSAADREMAVFAWGKEIDALAGELEKALARGVILLGVVCGSADALPEFVRHGFEQEVLDEQGVKLLVLVRDGLEALVGGIDRETTAALTYNSGLVRMGLEYVKHELYQAKIMKYYGRRFADDFGPHLEKLRPGPGRK